VAGGTNGAAPTWAHIVALETEVAQDNAGVGALAYMTNTKVRGKLKTTEKASGTGLFVWQDPANVAPGMPGAPLNGYQAFVTNQVSSTLTKGTSSGVCSAIFFGNWAELFIGMWADLEILVDPYTSGTAGIVRLIALMNADLAVRHPESFACMKDALTA
jgi:HK97 family phage major capsid protein